jgi:DNA polymerase-4
MSSSRARRLCPHAVFLPGRHGLYSEVSGRIMEILRSFTPLVEPLSLDEAFLDVAGARRLHGEPPVIAASIRQQIWDQEQLTCSVGVARTKTLAKLATEQAKPRPGRSGPTPGTGVAVVPPDGEEAFLRPLPVKALWGVGPATLERLQRLGVATVGDLADLPRDTVELTVGKVSGGHLHELANGHDDRPVVPDQQPKSVSHEETFARDHHDLDTLKREAVRLAESVAARLRAAGLAGRTVSVKVRFGDFRTITRAATLPDPADTGPTIARVAKELLDSVDPTGGVRLLGVSVTGLVDGGTRQLALELDGADHDRWDRASGAIDGIRERFGTDAIAPAALADGDRVRVDRRGAQPWGPDGTTAP